MSTIPLRIAVPFSQFDQLREARDIIRQEAESLVDLSGRLDSRFCDAADMICDCAGRILVTGMGKAGLIGQKISATLSSTGSRAHFLHPAEAVHGDLGCVHESDVILAISNSGETEEICRLLPVFRHLNAKTIAITADANSTLGSSADVVLELGRMHEAGELGLAPSTSTTAMLAMGDALALVVSRMKSFTATQFGVYHPGGSLGRMLKPVAEVMRQGEELRLAARSETVRETLQRLRSSGRRSGAILVVDTDGRLEGIFTDSDLARLLEQHRDEQLDRPLAEVMTPDPATIQTDACLNDAVLLLTDRKISELPVVDDEQKPIGLIDITDVIGLAPRCA